MTNTSTDQNITRGKDVGGATGDGNDGSFASKSQTAPDVTLAATGRREITVFDLEPGNILIGATGTRLRISNVEPSAAWTGAMALENEFGTLHLDSEETVTIAADGEQSWTIAAGERLPYEAFALALNDAQDRGEVAGHLYTRDTTESTINRILDEDDSDTGPFTGDELAMLGNKMTDPEFIADVHEVVTESHGWTNIESAEAQEAEDIFESEVIRAIKRVVAR